MRILYLIPQDAQSPYGNGRALPIANALARQGHTVTVLMLHANIAAAQRGWFTIDAVRARYVAQSHVKKVGNTKSYFGPVQLSLIILNAMLRLFWHGLWQPADLIIIGKAQPIAGGSGFLLATLKRVPCWVDADDYEAGSNRFSSPRQQQLLAWAEKRLCCYATGVLTNTDFMAKKINAWCPQQTVTRLPNGITAHWLTPTAAPETHSAQLETRHGPVIGFIGSLSSPSHPVTLLLQAFTQLIDKAPNATLLIVGGGEDWAALQAEARTLGIADACHFTGRVPAHHVKDYYSLCTVCVEPLYADEAALSRAPLKLFEAWATATPFLTSLLGERKTLYAGLPAAWFPVAGNVDALAEAIWQVIADAEIQTRLIAHGQANITAYQWDHLVKDLFADD